MENSDNKTLSFDSLNLHPSLLQGIEQSGFSSCTPIQSETLPLSLAGKDVAGQAQTGTGKTAAFLIAALQRLLSNEQKIVNDKRQPRALILAPTRELAIQIHDDACKLGEFTDLKLCVAFGGTDYEKQRKQLEDGCDIIIATPGRIIDYFKQHVFNLKSIEVMILDEADRMFDLGFIKDIRYLLRRMPKPEHRLSMLFSATLSHRVQELAYEHMNNPTHIRIEPEKMTAEKIVETVYYPAKEEKIPLLLGLLKTHDHHRVLIFCNTKRVVERTVDYLEANQYKAAMLSGDVPQKKRMRLLGDFSSGKLDILVATDVAARGLHIPDVSHVINFDIPQDPEDYVHRIGRTARAGATGDAISLACEEYVFTLPDIEEYIGHSIPVENIEKDLLIEPVRPEPRKRKPHHGARNKGSHNNRSGGHKRSGHRSSSKKPPDPNTK